MDKVMIVMCDGTKMLFPQEYAKKVMKKNDLVVQAMFYQKCMEENKFSETDDYTRYLQSKLQKIVQQIRTINRQVPPCGEVVR